MSKLSVEELLSYLETLSIVPEIQHHEPVYTMEDMERLNLSQRGPLCKNLFLRDAKGKQHFLVVVPEEKRMDLSTLAQKLGSSKLSFASAERLAKYLGLEQGSVTPLGILNDDSKSVTVVFDQDLSRSPRWGVHPNTNEATVWLSLQEMQTVVESHGNPCQTIGI